MKIGFLASHGGSAAKHLIHAIHNGELNAEIGPLVTNNRDSHIYHWCTQHNIAVSHISAVTHPDDDARDAAILAMFKNTDTDLIVLSGYMKKIGPSTLAHFNHKILNIHPSLLPKHGGAGMYGDRVFQAVLDAKDTITGASVQFITQEYDEGPVLAQVKVAVSPDETLETLKAKVQALEGDLYLDLIKKIIG